MKIKKQEEEEEAKKQEQEQKQQEQQNTEIEKKEITSTWETIVEEKKVDPAISIQVEPQTEHSDFIEVHDSHMEMLSQLSRPKSYSLSLSSAPLDMAITPLGCMTSPLSEKDLEKLAKTRERVTKELIDTEQSYVDALKTLVTEFIHPLKTSDKFDIPHEKITLMFSNVELLSNFHNMFLASLKTTKSIASVIIQYADFLKMYTQYLNAYPTALHTIDEYRNDKKFQHFLATKRAKHGLDLVSYLIMPVQRVPRYQLLLKELKRATPTDHEEHAKLEEAYTKIQAIATHINESKRIVEGMSKVLEIQNRITGDFGQLLQPHRRLIREGVVIKVVGGLITQQHIRKLFLFNDILLWTTDKSKFRGHLQLLGAKISPVVMSDKKRYGFKLEPHLHDGSYHGTNVSSTSTSSVASPGSDVKEKSKIKPIILFCKDEQEQKIWISDIRDAINNLAEKSDAMQKRKEEARLAKKKKSNAQIKTTSWAITITTCWSVTNKSLKWFLYSE